MIIANRICTSLVFYLFHFHLNCDLTQEKVIVLSNDQTPSFLENLLNASSEVLWYNADETDLIKMTQWPT